MITFMSSQNGLAIRARNRSDRRKAWVTVTPLRELRKAANLRSGRMDQRTQRRGTPMGLFDNIVSGMVKGLVRNVGPATVPGLASQYLAKTELGDATGLLERLRQGGLGAEVDSWLSPGPNLPVSAEQLRSALGEDVLAQLAAATGLSADKLLPLIAVYLPQTVGSMNADGGMKEREGEGGAAPA
jgi:uncharacterized protein YidB (DUF937 family)